jgi:hypothetical protein
VAAFEHILLQYQVSQCNQDNYSNLDCSYDNQLVQILLMVKIATSVNFRRSKPISKNSRGQKNHYSSSLTKQTLNTDKDLIFPTANQF